VAKTYKYDDSVCNGCGHYQEFVRDNGCPIKCCYKAKEIENKLKIAVEALKECADFAGYTNCEQNVPHVVKEALAKIGELKSPKQAIEKGNG